MHGKAVKLLDPVAVHPAHRIPGQRGKNVAVAEDEIPGAEQRENLPLIAIGEIRAWISENVVGVSSWRFLPFEVDFLTRMEEFHSVKNTR